MKKSWKLTDKILTGEKKIESRWYKTRRKPFDHVSKNDIIYFKDSGEKVRLKADVSDVIQFSDLDRKKIMEILQKYGPQDGIEAGKIPFFFNLFKDKKYCMLIFLKTPKEIEPFDINKKGFGAMSAWITVDDINEIRKKS